MTAGHPSQRRHQRIYNQKKKDDGFRQVCIWIQPDVVRRIERIASAEMLPFGVIVEWVLREAVLGGTA
jgi:hypothetical protein